MSKHADPKTAEATGTAIVKIEDITADNAPAIFGRNDLNRFVELVRAEVVGEVPDLTTDKGRKRIASLAAKVSRSKTALDGAGRAYLKKLKEMPKVIEAELRDFNTDMDALRDQVRKPLNEWEAEQAAKAAAQQAIIDQIIERYTLPAEATAEEIRGRLFALENEPIPAEIGDRLEEAEYKIKHGVAILGEALAKRVKYEDEQAELERLRKEAAERAEQDRIAEAQRQAVEQERQRVAQEEQTRRDAEANRLAQAEQQARDAEQRAQQAEQDRLDAEQRAADSAEQARLDEQRRQQEAADEILRQQAAREADKEHRGRINSEALKGLAELVLPPEAGGSELCRHVSGLLLKEIIKGIVTGKIPHVSITY